MKELEELDAFCQERGMWLTYCSYKGRYKCYVNPGTTMTVAPWYKDRDEAIRAAKEAAGMKERTTLENIQEASRLFNEVVEDLNLFVETYGNRPNVGDAIPAPEGMPFIDNAEKYDAVKAEYDRTGIIQNPIKKRGRPKGSKNKPKAVANE